MRHKDVRRCAYGAFGFYLLFRFHRSGEMEDEHRPNFAENRCWFDIKILSDGERGHNTKELQRRTYTDRIKSILKELKIMSSHFGHWGRVSGPVELEFEEVPPELIRILGKLLVGCCVCFVFTFSHLPLLCFLSTGNWDPKTQDARYSAKMPTIALRVIAGFLQGERYSLRRGMVKPSDALKEMIFDFIEEEMENIESAMLDDGRERPTAMLTLRLWIKLRTIILQDAAEISVRHPERMDHHMFRMPVFRSEEFKVSLLVCFVFLF
jgi:hypothetical protein